MLFAKIRCIISPSRLLNLGRMRVGGVWWICCYDLILTAPAAWKTTHRFAHKGNAREKSWWTWSSTIFNTQEHIFEQHSAEETKIAWRCQCNMNQPHSLHENMWSSRIWSSTNHLNLVNPQTLIALSLRFSHQKIESSSQVNQWTSYYFATDNFFFLFFNLLSRSCKQHNPITQNARPNN